MRVRRAARRCSRPGACFNPRTHEGATVIARVQDWMSDVSIHAPMRVRPEAPPPTPSSASFNPRTHEGATLRIKNEWDAERSFNPRTHEGATKGSVRGRALSYVSIHAPMRVRPLFPAAFHGDVEFNPRSHEGATDKEKSFLILLQVSIHAPMRVRLQYDGNITIQNQFQSTHP